MQNFYKYVINLIVRQNFIWVKFGEGPSKRGKFILKALYIFFLWMGPNKKHHEFFHYLKNFSSALLLCRPTSIFLSLGYIIGLLWRDVGLWFLRVQNSFLPTDCKCQILTKLISGNRKPIPNCTSTHLMKRE